MKYIYLVHEVEEIDLSHDEDTVIRAFTTLEAAQSCVKELKRQVPKDQWFGLETRDYYVSQMKLEGEL